MKNRILEATIVIGAVTALSAAAWAQSSPAPPPSGSYRSSCSSWRMVGSMLYANCRDSRGAPMPTSINPANCRGRDIVNVNGQLSCSVPRGADDSRVPPGSYRGVCPDVTVSGYVLSATCLNSSGGRVRSSMDLRTCTNRDIVTLDGRLVCSTAAARPWTPSSGQAGSAIPDGPYRATCPIVSLSLSKLKARCKDSRGETVKSELDLKACKGRDILNVDGRLTCTP